LIFEYFLKICRESSSLTNFWQEQDSNVYIK
jgi:hypothetical protein